jgi:hypothetical protein
MLNNGLRLLVHVYIAEDSNIIFLQMKLEEVKDVPDTDVLSFSQKSSWQPLRVGVALTVTLYPRR